ncbi:hypothetical protein TRAPUB_4678 [Trametes pubescens]|uniref:Uncharacterized protein n=1 Tax=Trametes pubescens TaxID=154538 RepID=A0A1M2VAR5_TRAPU|nr:hypothetical protein TRAPUB_4678 [Trametes pubescens]
MAAGQASSEPTANYPIPLWRYGFEWHPDKALELARRCKASGGNVWPPLLDKYDLNRDFDGQLAHEQLSSRRHGFRSAEIGRGADIHFWGMRFLQSKTKVRGIASKTKEAEDLKIELLRDARGLLLAEDSVDILREYFGEPQWYLDWKFVEKNKLLGSLKSGASQPLVGLPVPGTDLAPDA